MNKYLSAVFNPKFLVLPMILISSVSQAIEISNIEDIGVAVDSITKKSRNDWSCWETHPTPELSLFEGSFCGVIKTAAKPDIGEDGYVGVLRAENKGLSAIGRRVAVRNNKDYYHWVFGVTIAYDKRAAGSYQLELMDDDNWDYIAITDQSDQVCGEDKPGFVPAFHLCELTGIIPIKPRKEDYKTKKEIYARMVVFGRKKSTSAMVLSELELLTYWAGPGLR
jgi:hypothetical protein